LAAVGDLSGVSGGEDATVFQAEFEEAVEAALHEADRDGLGFGLGLRGEVRGAEEEGDEWPGAKAPREGIHAGLDAGSGR
jgi:hypothetical protein